MGQMLNLSCGCGYQKTVLTGEGLMSGKLPAIRRAFAEMDLSGFERAIAASADKPRYGMKSSIAHCPRCRELVSVPVLTYAENGRTATLQKPCPDCGGAVALREDAGACPKCGGVLRQEEAGLWD